MAPKSSGDQNVSSNKRKQPPTTRYIDPKRQKMQNARHIKVQSTDEAFSNGELNVVNFVKAREFEIKALENGMRGASQALRSRAFQEVPRDMRRRTASHNIKKVPKRLRTRAAKEMKMDNTPSKTRKRILSSQRMRIETVRRMQAITKRLKAAKAEKRKKDLEKAAESEVTTVPNLSEGDDSSALITRIKVRKPKPKVGILRQPPLPKAKFRKRQKAKQWLPTHLFHAKRATMSPPKEPLWGFALPMTPTEKTYRKTHRSTTLRGAVAWDTSYMSTIQLNGEPKSLIGLLKALGVGSANEDKFIWGQRGTKWLNGSRAWNGWLFKRQSYPRHAICPATILFQPLPDVEGTSDKTLWIQCHPSAFMELWEEILRLAKIQRPAVKLEDLRYEIGSIEITGSNATEALNGMLWPSADTNNGDTDIIAKVWKSLAALSNPGLLPRNIILPLNIQDPRLHYPPRTVPGSSKFDNPELVQICANWPLDNTSIPMPLFDKAARTKAVQALPSQKSINKRRSDTAPGKYPQPIKEDPSIPVLLISTNNGNGNQGSWTLLIPWKCVAPIWSCLTHYPVSTGGNVRFGGIDETRQVAFESNVPWFPADYPGTTAGRAWHERESRSAKLAWLRKPKGRRIEYESLNLGNGRKGELGIGWTCDWQYLVPDCSLMHIPSSFVRKALLDHTSEISDIAGGLFPVKITMINRAYPSHAARVYRLPTTDAQLREDWLAQIPGPRNKAQNSQLVKPGQPKYPQIPNAVDLIGFITTGNFNLARGKGSGIAVLSISRLLAEVEDVMQSSSMEQSPTSTRHYCIIRDSGQITGYLARWDFT